MQEAAEISHLPYVIPLNCITTQSLLQAEEASAERLEMSREVAGLRLKLTAATQQVEAYRNQAETADASPSLAKHHDAALAGLRQQHEAATASMRQEVNNLQEHLAQSKASSTGLGPMSRMRRCCEACDLHR